MAKQQPAGTAWLVMRQSALELWRNPLGLVLLGVIPAVFIGMIVWTASENSIPLKVFFGEETVSLVLLTQRQIGLVFVCAAVSGFLAAYYALILFHKDFGYFRFCVFMGLSPYAVHGGALRCVSRRHGALAGITTFGLSRVTTLEQPFPCSPASF